MQLKHCEGIKKKKEKEGKDKGSDGKTNIREWTGLETESERVVEDRQRDGGSWQW